MSLASNLQTAFTRVGTEFKAIRTLIGGSGTATISGLNTTNKTSLVAAINEVKTTADSAGGGGWTAVDASETVKGIVELATLAEVSTGTDSTRAVTAAGVRQERNAVKAEILGAGVPTALDTLDELAAALGDDTNFAATMTTALGNRVRADAAQSFTAPQMAQARANIDAASATDMGSPTTDFSATFVAALA